MGWFLGLLLMVTSAQAEPPILRVAMESEPASLDWNRTRSDSGRLILSFLMRGLFRYVDAKPVCDLCESYNVSKDGLTYTFSLKDTLWSDGKKLSSQHFKDSFLRLLDPSNPFPGASDFEVIQGAKERKKIAIEVKNPKEFSIRLSQPVSHFLHLLTLSHVYPIRKDLISQEGMGRTSLGPYFFAEWKKGKRIVLEGNPNFETKRPVYRLEFILGSHSDLVSRFQSGQIEILSNPTTEEILKFSQANVQVSPFWATRNLVFNVKKGPLSDLNLRKSILLAMNRDELPSLLKNGERKSTGLIPPSLLGNRDLLLSTQNLEQAQAARNRALPWPKWQELTLLIQKGSSEKKIASWLKSQLEKVYIRVKIESLESLKFYEKLESGKFQMALHTWSFRMASPFDLLRELQTNASQNYGGWTNVAYDSIYTQALIEKDEDKRKGLIDKITQILEVQEVGVVPLSYPTHSFLLSSRVSSFALTPFGDPDFVRISLKEKSGSTDP